MHWRVLYVNGDNGKTFNNAAYFDSFGVEHNSKETKKFIGDTFIITSIFRIEAYDSKMCGNFSIGFIDFILKRKSLLEYRNLHSPNRYDMNGKIILKYFQ